MTVIPSNSQALASARAVDHTKEALGRSLSRLSSGSKIVRPSDDATGAATAEKLSAQNARLQAAKTNVQNSVSHLQATDSFMDGVTTTLARLSELALYAKDPTKGPGDIALYQEEFKTLQEQLRQTIGGTTAQIGGTTGVASPFAVFNGLKLLGSDAAVPPANGGQVTIGDATGEDMTLPQINLRDGAISAIFRQDNAGNFLLTVTSPTVVADLNSATTDVFDERSRVGSAQSRLELVASTLAVESENLTAAVSRIRDVDFANESTQLAKYKILSDASSAMLVQANLVPQAALKLLQR